MIVRKPHTQGDEGRWDVADAPGQRNVGGFLGQMGQLGYLPKACPQPAKKQSANVTGGGRLARDPKPTQGKGEGALGGLSALT